MHKQNIIYKFGSGIHDAVAPSLCNTGGQHTHEKE